MWLLKCDGRRGSRLNWGFDGTFCIWRPASDFGRGKKAISYCAWIHPIYAIVTLLYRTLQSTRDTVIRRTWVMAVGSNVAFITAIATKPLQRETWLGYYWQPTETCLCFIQRYRPTYHRQPSLTYRLATIPHDWHNRVRNDPLGHPWSMIFVLSEKAYMRLPISDQ